MHNNVVMEIPSNWCVVKMHLPDSHLWWVGWHDLSMKFHAKEGFEDEKAAYRRCNWLNKYQKKYLNGR